MLDALSHIFSRFSVLECDFFPDYPLSRLTTLRIGGPCRLLAVPKSEEVLCELLSLLDERGIPRAILGNGSNLLAPDEGYRGVVIRTSALTEVKVTAHTVSAACGAPLSAVIKEATAHGIAGLSRLAGIPATLGGALYMNAGAFGECIGDAVLSVRAVPSAGGKPLTLSRAECGFGYRKSILQAKGLVLLSARLSGGWEPPAVLSAQSEESLRHRAERHPLNYPSAGSAFRHPSEGRAWEWIERAGLRGLRIGGAMVSEKHTGFIVNAGGATAADVRALIEHIRTVVYDRFGVCLVREIEYLGE